MKLFDFFAQGNLCIYYDYDEEKMEYNREITFPCSTDDDQAAEDISDVRWNAESRTRDFILEDLMDGLEDKEKLGQLYGVLIEGKNVDEADRMNMFNKYVKYKEAFDNYYEDDPKSEEIVDDLIEKQISILDKDFEEEDIVNAMKKYISLIDEEEGRVLDEFDLLCFVNDIPLFMLDVLVSAINDSYEDFDNGLPYFYFDRYDISFRHTAY